MPAPIEVRVRRLLGPREPIITRIVIDAWARWWKNSERTQLYRRSRACLVHNYMMIDANTALAIDGIHIIPGQETSYFLAENELLFRFKKGDERGVSSNVETQASLAFVEPEAPLIELPDVARVDIAYVINPLETLIQSILVVARDGDQSLWSYPIYPRAADSKVATLPVQSAAPASRDNVVQLPTSGAKEKKDQE